jgi:hypothetical protein
MRVRDTGIAPVADCYLRTHKRRRCAPHLIPNGAGWVFPFSDCSGIWSGGEVRSARNVHPAAHAPRLSTAAAHPAPELHGDEPLTNRSSESMVSMSRTRGLFLAGCVLEHRL